MGQRIALRLTQILWLAALAGYPASTLADANIQDIQIAPSTDHIRVVLELDAPITFAASGTSAFDLHGVASGGAVMKAGADAAPLNRVVLASDSTSTKLTFETSAPITAKAELLAPDAQGVSHLVVDLFKDTAPPAPVAPPALHVVSSASASAPHNVTAAIAPQARRPAVGPALEHPTSASQLETALLAVPAQERPQAPLNAAAKAPDPISMAPDLGEAEVVLPNAPRPSAATLAAAEPRETVPAASLHPVVAPAMPPPAAPVPANASALDAEKALDEGDAQSACRIAQGTAQTAPGDLRALAVLGECKLALNDAQSARATFASALAIDASYHRARIGLARAEASLGNFVAARAEYARVLGDNPPTDEAYRIVDAMALLGADGPVTRLSSSTN